MADHVRDREIIRPGDVCREKFYSDSGEQLKGDRRESAGFSKNAKKINLNLIELRDRVQVREVARATAALNS